MKSNSEAQMLQRDEISTKSYMAEQLHAIMQSTHDGFWRANREGRILDVNQRYAELSGYSHEELVGMSIDQLEVIESPQMVRERIDAIIKEGFIRFKSKQRRKNGSVWDVEVSSSALVMNNEVVTFLRDISDNRRAAEELENKNRELESFAYTVSHDLKSPLITIQTFAGMIREDMENGNYKRAMDDIKKIEYAAGKMGVLLADLLELSRVGKIMEASAEVDMNHLVQDVLTQLAGVIDINHLEIIVQPDLPAIFGDYRRLAEVFQNLIENAIKYMGDQTLPQIEIGTRYDGNETVFFVSDNGIGIEPGDHEKIFGLFSKLDSVIEGTGIGLALVKRIINVHGGRVWVESEGVGKGSRFCFTIVSQVG